MSLSCSLGLTAKALDVQQLNIAGKQKNVKFSCASVSIMVSCAYKCGFIYLYIIFGKVRVLSILSVLVV